MFSPLQAQEDWQAVQYNGHGENDKSTLSHSQKGAQVLMDRMYLKTTIESLEREMSLHPLKFATNPAHQNCLPNFEQAINKLKLELAKLEAGNGLESVSDSSAV